MDHRLEFGKLNPSLEFQKLECNKYGSKYPLVLSLRLETQGPLVWTPPTQTSKFEPQGPLVWTLKSG